MANCLGNRTINIDEAVTMSNQSIADFKQIKKADAQPKLRQDLSCSIRIVSQCKMVGQRSNLIAVLLVDIVLDRLSAWFEEIFWYDADQIRNSRLQKIRCAITMQ